MGTTDILSSVNSSGFGQRSNFFFFFSISFLLYQSDDSLQKSLFIFIYLCDTSPIVMMYLEQTLFISVLFLLESLSINKVYIESFD